MGAYKLGKLPPRYNANALRLEKYLPLKANLPPIPTAFDYGSGVAFQMWLNDQLGDCTCAASAGLIATWTTRAGSPALVSNQDVLTAYEAVSGYNPQTGQNDNGAMITDVLKYWQQTGIGGHHLGAYGDVGNGDMSLIFTAVYLCEGLTIGVQLPAYCENTTQWLQASQNIVGGHDIILTGADGTGNLVGYTWGGRKLAISPAFMAGQCDELHFCLSQDQLDGNGVAANKLDLGTLQADIESIGKLDTPPMVVPPTPTPNPPNPSPAPPAPPAPVVSAPTLAQVQGIADTGFNALASQANHVFMRGLLQAINYEQGQVDAALKALPWPS